ncbi:receptor-type tyrosine-protein phosphatase epsilon-like [Crassostrea angulata]|uniref:receptor-type tyrosine-protein phosphatase epsilon-like n=1 Tax=Magallana angulata TaxID=2784310 RepID=UPI0022B2161B|nr:receptor-type tyrosine-protein phosphatase epsilon-like [Crassostrea angulata]
MTAQKVVRAGHLEGTATKLAVATAEIGVSVKKIQVTVLMDVQQDGLVKFATKGIPNINGFFSSECDGGLFGEKCTKFCSHCSGFKTCYHVTGICFKRCKPGYMGEDCRKKCEPGLFGVNCSSGCGHCLKNKPCHFETGVCSEGCEPGYRGNNCKKKCDDGLFGINCSTPCGHCFDNQTCHHINGSCYRGCEVGYREINCTEECTAGFYGLNCEEMCNATCNSCNKKSGFCEKGCKPGWKGNFCQSECDNYFYGDNCSSRCGHCFGNIQCHYIDGTCKNGCTEGFKGSKCTEGCQTGTFGMNCNKTCSINCKNRSICEKDTGHCIDGCAAGWKGDICNKKCDNNMFGENCEQKCGHCANSSNCNPVNGSCQTGCDLGFQGPLCNDECISGQFGYNCMDNCSSLCVDGRCDKKSGACKRIAFRASSPNDENDNELYIGVGVGLFVIIIAAVISVVVVKRFLRVKRKPKEIKTSERSHCGFEMKTLGQRDGLKMDNKDETSPVYDGFISVIPKDTNYSNVNINTALDIPIDKLEIVIAEKRKNDNEGFRKEYAAIPRGELHSCEFGKKPENVPKNIYKTTFPYDHSRVVLDNQSSEHSDYINANYIEGANRQKEYIATQGPKSNTLGDFWRMIWQENVSSVVMVTNLVKGEKVKCNKYWPDKDNHALYGPVQVTLMEEKEYACFTTRQLSVLHKKLKCTRVVTQYHYTAWPDHGVPEPLCLLTFHNHVITTSANNSQSPTIVHCSAGVGRTGTYIALDALFQIGKKTGKVNVAEFVAKMRQNRVLMVQTYEQYITIYLALNEVFKAPVKLDTMVEFLKKAEKARKNIPVNQNPLHDEFQLLLKIRQKYSKDDYNFAMYDSEDQLSGEILSLKKYGLYLSPNKTTRGNYINAIAVPSFTNLQHFIVTKYPLEENATDLLRLLSDHESDTVISLQPLSGIKLAKAWLPPVSSSIKIPPFTVHHRSESQTDVITHEIQIVHDNAEVRTVIIVEPEVEIQCSGSSVDTSQLRSLVSTVLYLVTKQPITILSSDDASQCGLFIAVHNVIQQMNMDDRVDVFTAVRQLQIRRPEFCAKFEDYQLIYQAVMDHCQNTSENIY